MPFARIDPRTARPDVDARDALDAGARGLKLHPRAEEFGLDHPGAETAPEDARTALILALAFAATPGLETAASHGELGALTA